MNKRELSSEVFVSPRRISSPRKKLLIHDTKAWRARTENNDIALPIDDSENDTLQDRRKQRLREAKQKQLRETLEKNRRRQKKREIAELNNKKVQQTLEQRKKMSRSLQTQFATAKSPHVDPEPQNPAQSAQPFPKKSHMKKIIRRKIIKRVLRKPVEPPPQDDKREIYDEVSYEEEVLVDGDFEEVTERELDEEDDYDVHEVHSSSEIEEEVLDHSSSKEHEFSGHDSEDLDNTSDEHAEAWENDSGAGQDDPFEVIPTEQDVDEDVTVEDDMMDELASDQGDEEEFFTQIRDANEPDDDDHVSLSASERLRQEEEEFLREQEELFRLAAERQAEEEEDLRWEEEQLALEEEARRLASLHATEGNLDSEDDAGMSQRKETLLDKLQSRPALRSTTGVKQAGEESVLDRPIGYRPPSLLALVNKAKLELRPSPPEEHKEQYVPVVQDAASIGRLLRLHEVCVEAQGKRNPKDFNTTSTDRSYALWELNHSQRGQKRMPVTRKTRSTAQIMVNEAAAVGKLRTRRSVDHQGLAVSMHGNEVDIDDLGDVKHDGAKVFRTKHLIDRMVGENRRMKMTDWTPDYDDEEYEDLDDVQLPTPHIPRFSAQKSTKSQEQLREEMSRAVAEGYWGRHYRLERPGAKLNVTEGCYCKYCNSPNAWQTFAYQKKWAEERLPARDQIDQNADPTQFGYLTRLYLPQESPDDVSFVDLKDIDNAKNLDLGSEDGTCSVDFSLGSLDLIDESDENSSGHDSFAGNDDATAGTHSIAANDSFAGDSASFGIATNDNASKQSTQSTGTGTKSPPGQIATHDDQSTRGTSGRTESGDPNATDSFGFLQESQDATYRGPSEANDHKTSADAHAPTQLQRESLTTSLLTEHSPAGTKIVSSEQIPAGKQMMASQDSPAGKQMISSQHSPADKQMISSEGAQQAKKQSRFWPLKWVKKAFSPSKRSNADGRQGSLTMDEVSQLTQVEESSKPKPSPKATDGVDMLPATMEEGALLENTTSVMNAESNGDVIVDGDSGIVFDSGDADSLEKKTNQAEFMAGNAGESNLEGVPDDHQSQNQDVVAIGEPLTDKSNEFDSIQASEHDDGLESEDQNVPDSDISSNRPQESTSTLPIQGAVDRSEGETVTRLSLTFKPKQRKSNGILANLREYQKNVSSTRMINSSFTSDPSPEQINATSSSLVGGSEPRESLFNVAMPGNVSHTTQNFSNSSSPGGITLSTLHEYHSVATVEGHALNANNEQCNADNNEHGSTLSSVENNDSQPDRQTLTKNSDTDHKGMDDQLLQTEVQTLPSESDPGEHLQPEAKRRLSHLDKPKLDAEAGAFPTGSAPVVSPTRVGEVKLSETNDAGESVYRRQMPGQVAHSQQDPAKPDTFRQSQPWPGDNMSAKSKGDLESAVMGVKSMQETTGLAVKDTGDIGSTSTQQRVSKIVPGGNTFKAAYSSRNLFEQNVTPSMGRSSFASPPPDSTPQQRLSKVVPSGDTFKAAFSNKNLFEQNVRPSMGTSSPSPDSTPQQRLSKIVPGGNTFKAAYSNKTLFEQNVSPSKEKSKPSSTSPDLVMPSKQDEETAQNSASATIPNAHTRKSWTNESGSTTEDASAAHPRIVQTSDRDTGNQNITSAKARLGKLAQLRAKKQDIDQAKAKDSVQVTSNPRATTSDSVAKEVAVADNHGIIGNNVPQSSGNVIAVAKVEKPSTGDLAKQQTEVSASAPVTSPTRVGAVYSSVQMTGQVTRGEQDSTKLGTFPQKQPLSGGDVGTKSQGGLESAVGGDRNVQETKALPLNDTAAIEGTSSHKRVSRIMPGGSTFKAAFSNRNLFEQTASPSKEKSSPSSISQDLQGQKAMPIEQSEENAEDSKSATRPGINVSKSWTDQSRSPIVATTEDTSTAQRRIVQAAKSMDIDAGNQNATSAKARLGKLALLRAKKQNLAATKTKENVPVLSKPHATTSETVAKEVAVPDSHGITGNDVSQSSGNVIAVAKAEKPSTVDMAKQKAGVSANAPVTPPTRVGVVKVSDANRVAESVNLRQTPGQVADHQQESTKPGGSLIVKSQGGLESAVGGDGNVQETKALPENDTVAIESTPSHKRLSRIVPGGSTFKAAFSNRNLFEQTVSPSKEKSNPSATRPGVNVSKSWTDQSRSPIVATTEDTSTAQRRIVQTSKSMDLDAGNQNVTSAKARLGKLAQLRAKKQDLDQAKTKETVPVLSKPHATTSETVAVGQSQLFSGGNMNAKSKGGLESAVVGGRNVKETKGLPANDTVDIGGTSTHKRISRIVPGGSHFKAAFSNRNLFE